jgi:hypothetical protein
MRIKITITQQQTVTDAETGVEIPLRQWIEVAEIEQTLDRAQLQRLLDLLHAPAERWAQVP